MTDLIVALRSELESLEAELAADLRYRKLEKIRELLGSIIWESATLAACGACVCVNKYLYRCAHEGRSRPSRDRRFHRA